MHKDTAYRIIRLHVYSKKMLAGESIGEFSYLGREDFGKWPTDKTPILNLP